MKWIRFSQNQKQIVFQTINNQRVFSSKTYKPTHVNMKFMLAVVILAFVACANANAIGRVVEVAHQHSPVGSHGPALVNVHDHHDNHGDWDNNGWNNGWNNNGWGHSVGIGGHGLPSLVVNGWGVDSHHDAGHAHGHGHDGKYIASNRGAVHVAPLVGHVQSVKSTNADPAPGTTW